MLKPTSFILMGAIALLSSCTSPSPLAQGTSSTGQPTATSASPLSYEAYGMVLRTYVNAAGLVDYPALQANPMPLKEFVAALGAVSPNTYEAWSDQEKIAFLVNAYNAITLESIIDQKPLKGSIKDIWGVWNGKKHLVMGQSITLDAIEHEILRKDFQEPRIHAALVCAAISCAPLRPEPYTGEQLDQQLDAQVRQWLASRGVEIDRAQERVSISSIFDWFGEDWQAGYSAPNKFAGSDKERAVLNFISTYMSPEDKDYLVQGQYKVDYLEYDWSLNQQ